VNIRSIISRKVFGIPVLYLAALVVAILAFFAWRLKDTSDESGDPETADDATDIAGDPSGLGQPTFSAGTGATPVTTPPGQIVPETQDDNERWARRAIEWLYGQNHASVSGAQSAIAAFIAGNDLTYTQSALVNKAIKQFGLPPEPVQRGKTLPNNAPAKRQGTPPTNHVVQGTNDNTFKKLCVLYYGDAHYDNENLMEVANLGVVPKTAQGRTIARGTTVKIPKRTSPKYYTATTRVNTPDAIARVNGTTPAVIRELNDSLANKWRPGVPPKTRVRVA
jgi:hypothetical protein